MLESANKTMSQSTVVRCVLGHAEEQEKTKTLFIPLQTEGDRPTAAGDSSCRRHLHSLPATAQRITLNQGMTAHVDCGVGKRSNNDNIICCLEKGRSWNSAWF